MEYDDDAVVILEGWKEYDKQYFETYYEEQAAIEPAEGTALPVLPEPQPVTVRYADGSVETRPMNEQELQAWVDAEIKDTKSGGK